VILAAPDRSNAGLLVRYLDFRGIKHVDALLVPDHGNQIGSGLVRLAGAYPVACVVGPDDAVILEALSQAVPGAQVYPGTGASVKALGGADIQLDEKEMRITVGGQKIFKSARV
jgi:hypothetical protein